MEKKAAAQQLRRRLEDLIDQGVADLPRPRRKPGAGGNAAKLQAIRDEIGDCQRCKLCQGRTNIVFGVGDPNAKLLFIGEGPGRDEDLKGEPFVGRAGQLLTKMIEAMGLKRSEVYIANIVKCRPPDNRYPEPDEVETCQPFLMQQIAAIKPKVAITLGNLATQTLLQTKTGITALHGTFREWNGIQVMPTYHPAFLLRNPNMKKPCWEDLKKVIQYLKEN
jgi:uracil-DNA glycosylase family 4